MGKRYFFVLCFVLMAGSSSAFFPPASEIASRVQDQYEDLKSYQVRMEANATQGEGSINFWWDRKRWRREWVQQKDSQAVLQRVALGEGFRLDAALPQVRTVPAPLLVLWQDVELLSRWRQIGVFTEAKRYAFWEQRPCVVLGNVSTEQGQLTEVWVDTERWVVLRLVWGQGGSVSFSKYHNVGNFLLPHHLEVIDSQGEKVQISLNWQGVNTKLPSRLFDASELRTQYGAAAFPDELSVPVFNWLRDVLPRIAR
ncbi:MAG: LolA family protein [Thermodesulfobacteriota bacterium]